MRQKISLMEMASDMNVWWKNMVGSEKNSLVMQSLGTVCATFKMTNSSREQRKASNMRTLNLWKRRKIIIQKVV